MEVNIAFLALLTAPAHTMRRFMGERHAGILQPIDGRGCMQVFYAASQRNNRVTVGLTFSGEHDP